MKAQTLLEFYDQLKIDQNKISPLHIDNTIFQKIIRDQKDFLKYHRNVSLLRQIHQKGKQISEKQQRVIISNAIQSEQAFNNSIQSSLEILSSNKTNLKYAQEKIVANFDDFRIYSNPIFFDKKVRGTLLNMGLSMQELRHYHHVLSNNERHVKSIKQAFQKESFDSILKKASSNFKNRPFPESQEALRKMGILTITGGSFWDDIGDFFVGAVTIAVAVVAVFVPFIGPVIGGAIGTIGAIGYAGVDLFGKSPSPEPALPISSDPCVYWVYPDPPTSETPYYGNISRSKMEVHNASCPWLHSISSKNIKVYNSLADAHADGLDNCAHCIGGSIR